MCDRLGGRACPAAWATRARGTGLRLSVGLEVERGFDEGTLSRVLAVLARPEVVP